MTDRLAVLLLAAALAFVACGGVASPPPSPGASPPPAVSPSPAGPLTAIELKYLLLDRFGKLWYCDPDEYPVSRGDEAQKAIERWPEVTADGAAFALIARRVGLDPSAEPTDQLRFAAYREWKMLNAIFLDPLGDRYRFDIHVQPAAGAGQGARIAGIARADGAIEVEQQTASDGPMCPICLARGTLIATPDGDVPVEDLRAGMTVWTTAANGRRVEGTVLRVGSAAVPKTHEVVRLVLDDGRTVTVSPGHPLADGRPVGDLRPGDLVDGGWVVSADLVRYGQPTTYDLLPSGDTGTYFANGILLGSTLAP